MQGNKALITYSHFSGVLYSFRSKKSMVDKFGNGLGIGLHLLSFPSHSLFHFVIILFFFPFRLHFNSANNATIKNTHIKMRDRLDVSLISGAQQPCLNRHSLRSKRFRANFRAKTRLETHATLAKTGKPFGLHFAFSSIAK